MLKYPVIIDTDPGVDDTFAIMMAKASPEFDIKALTVMAGNVDIGFTLNNALGLAELLGIDVPVYKGAEKPLIVEFKDASEYHGESGLGYYKLKEVNKKAENEYAWDGIYKLAKEHKGELSIIALGPLTNIAIALLKYPDLPKYIKRLVIMGGTFYGYGNTTPYSEFNFWCDPHAAEIVLQSDLKKQIIGLNTTKQVILEEEDMNMLSSKDSNIEELIRSMIQFSKDNIKVKQVSGSFHIPDAVALAAMIKPEIFEFENHYVTCVTDGGLTQGWSIVDDRNKLGRKPNADIALSVNKEEYFKLLLRINALRGDI